MQNTELNGGDLELCTGGVKVYKASDAAVANGAGVHSADECCKLCGDDPDCFAWQYGATGSTVPGCYVKAKTGWTTVKHDNVTSGVHTSEGYARKLQYHMLKMKRRLLSTNTSFVGL